MSAASGFRLHAGDIPEMQGSLEGKVDGRAQSLDRGLGFREFGRLSRVRVV